jgi:hypothetical protein
MLNFPLTSCKENEEESFHRGMTGENTIAFTTQATASKKPCQREADKAPVSLRKKQAEPCNSEAKSFAKNSLRIIAIPGG